MGKLLNYGPGLLTAVFAASLASDGNFIAAYLCGMWALYEYLNRLKQQQLDAYVAEYRKLYAAYLASRAQVSKLTDPKVSRYQGEDHGSKVES
jgi:hypothetical protein